MTIIEKEKIQRRINQLIQRPVPAYTKTRDWTPSMYRFFCYSKSKIA